MQESGGDNDPRRPESQRPDGAHRAHAQAAIELAIPGGLEHVRPALRHALGPGQTALAMERLDTLVFQAMAGQTRALEEMRVAWPAVQLELPVELITQVREEYLKYALTIWNRYLAHDLPDPARAVDALEVMCLLFDD